MLYDAKRGMQNEWLIMFCFDPERYNPMQLHVVYVCIYKYIGIEATDMEMVFLWHVPIYLLWLLNY